MATDTTNASVRGEISLHADIYTPYYILNSFTFLQGPFIPPVSTRISVTFRDYGELEPNRALFVETMYGEITPKVGLLTLSHLPVHLKGKNWPLRIAEEMSAPTPPQAGAFARLFTTASSCAPIARQT